MPDPSKMPPICEDTVKQWLAEVKAPQPWDLNALPAIAWNLDGLRQQTPYREESIKQHRPINRVQNAVDELRRALILFLDSPGFKSEEAFWSQHSGPAALDFQQRTAAARHMLASLVNISAPNPVNDIWVELARDAYQFYQALVPSPLPNKASKDATNPPVLFVAKAVRAMGGPVRSSATIYKAIATRTTAADKYEAEHGIAVQRLVPPLPDKGM